MTDLLFPDGGPPDLTRYRPAPGQACPCCGTVFQGEKKIKPLRVGAEHPETAHDARAIAQKVQTGRAMLVMLRLEVIGNAGQTDDAIDEEFGWGHQSTSALMNSLRRSGLIGWKYGPDGKPVKHKTRKGNDARVNVLAKYCVHGAKDG